MTTYSCLNCANWEHKERTRTEESQGPFDLYYASSSNTWYIERKSDRTFMVAAKNAVEAKKGRDRLNAQWLLREWK